jgi:hypothetical protein
MTRDNPRTCPPADTNIVKEIKYEGTCLNGGFRDLDNKKMKDVSLTQSSSEGGFNIWSFLSILM